MCATENKESQFHVVPIPVKLPDHFEEIQQLNYPTVGFVIIFAVIIKKRNIKLFQEQQIYGIVLPSTLAYKVLILCARYEVRLIAFSNQAQCHVLFLTIQKIVSVHSTDFLKCRSAHKHGTSIDQVNLEGLGKSRMFIWEFFRINQS